jgi:hypothetical protein
MVGFSSDTTYMMNRETNVAIMMLGAKNLLAPGGLSQPAPSSGEFRNNHTRKGVRKYAARVECYLCSEICYYHLPSAAASLSPGNRLGNPRSLVNTPAAWSRSQLGFDFRKILIQSGYRFYRYNLQCTN